MEHSLQSPIPGERETVDCCDPGVAVAVPCHYETPEQELERSVRDLRIELDRATRAACEAINQLTGDGAELSAESKFLRAWWIQHQKRDQQRLEAERIRKQSRAAERIAEVERERLLAQALLKLTDEERRAFRPDPRWTDD